MNSCPSRLRPVLSTRHPDLPERGWALPMSAGAKSSLICRFITLPSGLSVLSVTLISSEPTLFVIRVLLCPVRHSQSMISRSPSRFPCAFATQRSLSNRNGSLKVARDQTTTGHLNVDVRGMRLPIAADSLAAVMISSTCNACSGVTSSSLPVARHSAARDAPCCQR